PLQLPEIPSNFLTNRRKHSEFQLPTSFAPFQSKLAQIRKFKDKIFKPKHSVLLDQLQRWPNPQYEVIPIIPQFQQETSSDQITDSLPTKKDDIQKPKQQKQRTGSTKRGRPGLLDRTFGLWNLQRSNNVVSVLPPPSNIYTARGMRAFALPESLRKVEKEMKEEEKRKQM
ncbi:MAG: hypothetical protein EZS28_056577, partial [Streblomastix strix]